MAMTQEEQQLVEDSKKAKAVYEEETKKAAWLAEAYKFLSRAPSYPNNDANATIMKGILAGLGLAWTAENMERVWGDQKFRSRFTAAVQPVAQAAVAAEPEPPAAPVDPYEGITIETIQRWSRDEFKENYKRKKQIVDRLLAEFAQAHPGVDAFRFNRGSY
jgi:hypothetical protein